MDWKYHRSISIARSGIAGVIMEIKTGIGVSVDRTSVAKWRV